MALVRNLLTGDTFSYSCPPKQAVIAAHAQQRGDFNTWDYATRYSSLVRESSLCYVIGDLATFKDGREG